MSRRNFKRCECGSETSTRDARDPIAASVIWCTQSGHQIYAADADKPGTDPDGTVHRIATMTAEEDRKHRQWLATLPARRCDAHGLALPCPECEAIRLGPAPASITDDAAVTIERRHRLAALATSILRTATCHPKDDELQQHLAALGRRVERRLAATNPHGDPCQ